MARESYGFVGNWTTLEHFFFVSEMTRDLYPKVEYPSLIKAMEQELILKKLANQNYRFKLYIERNSPNAVIGNDVIYVELEFLDMSTQNEYELMR